MPLYGDKKREYDRAWMKARRDSYFNGRKCITCGCDHKLELDHINPKEKATHKVVFFVIGYSFVNYNLYKVVGCF